MERINLEFIARRRMEFGITLQDMAFALGFKNASTYLKYEKGEYDFKAKHLPMLTRMLSCELRDLFICLVLVLLL
ncbi:helix-turn-helix domain-containing protein [Brevibacillus borstelensis]|uniref:helix-turn-helix domain-containing protein n=1 Tax=Brevibacillus borstelensis TaxID=45462 RepID=UPI0030C5B07C